MKKVILIIINLILVVTLSGCSTVESEPAGTKNTNDKTQLITENIPDYTDKIYVEINGNKTEFSDEDKKRDAFELYTDLDELGRCGAAYANVCKELMPTEKRGSIGMIKPSGWQLAKYDSVDGKYLYNRSHLIGFQLAGENANEKNLITGTRYFNVVGMLPFENEVAEYVKETNNHVLYRVTPVFKDTELVARGVKIEAYSVEDSGEGVEFNVFVYNVQPDITINYQDGTSSGSGQIVDGAVKDNETRNSEAVIGNKNTKVYHDNDCGSLPKEDNRIYFDSAGEAENAGYRAHACI
ncbi:DNA/RNA non-specific endonuclease [Thomasclavelia ramosa]|uniref:DNA/RNA non-specific endonuclease n=1 Tax=Thomasclavelia ramosa TaxID=1547 RepID=UPI0022E94117